MNKMSLTGKPFGKRILVFPDVAERVTKGGIIIPETSIEKPSCGTIMQVGYDYEKDKPLNVQPGQRVLYGKYSGMEIDFEEGTCILMYESDLIYAWPYSEAEEQEAEIKKKKQTRATVLQ